MRLNRRRYHFASDPELDSEGRFECARAALEQTMSDELKSTAGPTNVSARLPEGSAAMSNTSQQHPTVAELDAQIATRPYRRGVGRMFWNRAGDGLVGRLPPLPEAP